MTEPTLRIRLIVQNPDIHKKLRQIIAATEGNQAIEPEDARRPDLMIVELGEKPDEAFGRIQTLMDADQAGGVFIIAPNADPDLLKKALKIGAKEFFTPPIEEDELKTALEAFRKKQEKRAETMPARKDGRIISILGSKGGVGATTVAVNLAVCMAEKSGIESVALLDMNSLFGEIPLFLELAPQFHWGEITKNIERLDETFLMNVISRHATGVSVLPSPGYLNGHSAPTPDTMGRVLRLMKTMFDYVIIDSGQSTDDTALKIFQLSDWLLLISTLTLPCLSNTNKLLKSLVDLGYLPKERIRIIMNRYTKKGDLSLEAARQSIGHDLFWTIPNDYVTTMSAINQGKPLVEIAPRAAITRNFREMTDALGPRESAPEKRRWSFFKKRK